MLEKIGGLEQLSDYLGDDYELGARAAAAGFQVALPYVVLETSLPDYSFADFWLHQMRWARNVKDRRPSQYFGLIATFGLAWGILGVLLLPFTWWTWGVLAVTAIARFTSAIIVGQGVLKDTQVVPNLWLIPARDFIALAIWIASFFGNTVVWRGTRFRLRDGKLQAAK